MMKRTKLIVFDMDGVLIDVSGSYRETVRKTARLFFDGADGFEKLPDPLFPLKDLAGLKQTGGLNNDWDLTAMALRILFAIVKTPTLPASSSQFTETEDAIRRCDVSQLADFLKTSASPLLDLLDRYGRRQDPLVAKCYQGDVDTGNRIKRIFQEIYLGPPLFASLYGCEPRFYHGEGLIHAENLLIDQALLADLSGNHILAIATGRPRAEADFPLDRFDLRQYFQLVVTLDDCRREEELIYAEQHRRMSLNKPSPYMLDLIVDRVGRGLSLSECYYLGDMPDDMQAARSSKSGYSGIGVLISSADPENLREALMHAGAKQIITDFSALPNILA